MGTIGSGIPTSGLAYFPHRRHRHRALIPIVTSMIPGVARSTAPESSIAIWRPHAIDPVTLSDGTTWHARGVFIGACRRRLLSGQIVPQLKANGAAEFTGDVWRVF
jgi:hypothetical protein